MRSANTLLVVATVTGAACFVPRTDARLHPGLELGVASAVVMAPRQSVRKFGAARDAPELDRVHLTVDAQVQVATPTMAARLRLPFAPGTETALESGGGAALYPLVGARLDLYHVVSASPRLTWGVGIEAAVVPAAYGVVTSTFGKSTVLSGGARLLYAGAAADNVASGQVFAALNLGIATLFVSYLYAGGSGMPVDGKYSPQGEHTTTVANSLFIGGIEARY